MSVRVTHVQTHSQQHLLRGQANARLPDGQSPPALVGFCLGTQKGDWFPLADGRGWEDAHCITSPEGTGPHDMLCSARGVGRDPEEDGSVHSVSPPGSGGSRVGVSPGPPDAHVAMVLCACDFSDRLGVVTESRALFGQLVCTS